MDDRYGVEMNDGAFQEYLMECRQRIDTDVRIRTRQALDDGHNPACMLTRGGNHCTCGKEAA